MVSIYSEDFLGGEGFKPVLAIFCSYDNSANTSEAVEKIATDEKDNRKCFLCFIVGYIATVHPQ